MLTSNQKSFREAENILQQLSPYIGDYQAADQAFYEQRIAQGFTPDQARQELIRERDRQRRSLYGTLGSTQGQTYQSNAYYDPTTEQWVGVDNRMADLAGQYGGISSDLAAKKSAYQQAAQGLSEFDQQSLSLMQAQEQQAQYEHQQEIQAELADLQNRIENAPETLTEDEVSRFRDLVTGQTQFDDIVYDTGRQARAAQAMLEKAQRADTEQGRRELLRGTFGADRYTSAEGRPRRRGR